MGLIVEFVQAANITPGRPEKRRIETNREQPKESETFPVFSKSCVPFQSSSKSKILLFCYRQRALFIHRAIRPTALASVVPDTQLPTDHFGKTLVTD
ncbi:hypothetical protein ACLIKD_20415 [Azonexus sp. IMCC34842]|uniref:hypothetical protein n=1 Tax=Azonexus sp. IMCC34842 TaxID=3420950 RepID=UPI003D1015DD